jgi:hypothetical protein
MVIDSLLCISVSARPYLGTANASSDSQSHDIYVGFAKIASLARNIRGCSACSCVTPKLQVISSGGSGRGSLAKCALVS